MAGYFLKRYARQVAPVFSEAWQELAASDSSVASGAIHKCLGLKTWVVIPKVASANTIRQLRDLELGNEIRKILARMLLRLLDEVCQNIAGGLT